MGREVQVTCTKRAFDGVHSARRAHRGASFRIRVYQCEACGKYHVTNQDKRERRWDRDDYDEVSQ